MEIGQGPNEAPKFPFKKTDYVGDDNAFILRVFELDEDQFTGERVPGLRRESLAMAGKDMAANQCRTSVIHVQIA